jgi:RNA polymerase sigma factor (sigma-70 family)
MEIIKHKEKFSDLEIIQKILEGETALFEILIRRNNPFLHKTGRSYGYSHEDTQDLMQETFLSAYLNLSKFENRSSFKTWIIKIMLNKCFHKQQKFSFKNEVSNSINEMSIPMYSNMHHADMNKTIVSRELNHVIEHSLLQLPEEYRMVFSLREVNGLSVAETAEALNISEANVKTRLSRAKSMLREEIKKAYTSEDIFEFNLVFCDAMVNRVMSEINKQ